MAFKYPSAVSRLFVLSVAPRVVPLVALCIDLVFAAIVDETGWKALETASPFQSTRGGGCRAIPRPGGLKGRVVEDFRALFSRSDKVEIVVTNSCVS